MTSMFIEDINRRLKDLAETPTAEISKDWVHVVMSLFRQHLDSSDERNKYQVLRFFCNWILHVDLHKGIVQDKLEKISQVITDDTTGHPADRISEILSLSQLRSEIRDILNRSGVKSGLFDDYKNWKAFTELMFPFLMEKPLRRKKSPETHHWVESLELYDKGGQVFWRIETLPGNHKFNGPLFRTDPESPKE